MDSRVVTFSLAIVTLLGIRAILAVAARKGHPFFVPGEKGRETWNVSRLFLVSFLTLFAELAFIRWMAVEVRVFAYVKNLALLLCFVGFGLGCALARKAVRWPSAVVCSSRECSFL